MPIPYKSSYFNKQTRYKKTDVSDSLLVHCQGTQNIKCNSNKINVYKNKRYYIPCFVFLENGLMMNPKTSGYCIVSYRVY